MPTHAFALRKLSYHTFSNAPEIHFLMHERYKGSYYAIMNFFF